MLRWLRRVAYILAAPLIASAAYIVTVYFFGSKDVRGRLVLIYAAIVANHHPPPIAASGVVSTGPDWMMPEPASTKFTAILRRNFPPRSDEQAMRAALVSQGFKVEKIADCGEGNGAIVPRDSKRRCRTRELAQSLRYDWGGVPCDMRLTARWTADRNGRLAAIERKRCPSPFDPPTLKLRRARYNILVHRSLGEGGQAQGEGRGIPARDNQPLMLSLSRHEGSAVSLWSPLSAANRAESAREKGRMMYC